MRSKQHLHDPRLLIPHLRARARHLTSHLRPPTTVHRAPSKRSSSSSSRPTSATGSSSAPARAPSPSPPSACPHLRPRPSAPLAPAASHRAPGGGSTTVEFPGPPRRRAPRAHMHRRSTAQLHLRVRLGAGPCACSPARRARATHTRSAPAAPRTTRQQRRRTRGPACSVYAPGFCRRTHMRTRTRVCGWAPPRAGGRGCVRRGAASHRCVGC